MGGSKQTAINAVFWRSVKIFFLDDELCEAAPLQSGVKNKYLSMLWDL